MPKSRQMSATIFLSINANETECRTKYHHKSQCKYGPKSVLTMMTLGQIVRICTGCILLRQWLHGCHYSMKVYKLYVLSKEMYTEMYGSVVTKLS